MSGLDHLRNLALGRRPADAGLLGNTRFAWGGTDFIGEEGILAAFAARPFALDEAGFAVETAQNVALVSRSGALVADLYEGRIGRLWRVGDAPPGEPEPAIDVAFDPDMRQERGSLNFRGEDHPDLDPAAAPAVLAAAEDLIARTLTVGLLRVRGFVVRAFGTEAAAAALVALYTMGNEANRSAGFRYAVVAVDKNGARAVADTAARRPWTPRF